MNHLYCDNKKNEKISLKKSKCMKYKRNYSNHFDSPDGAITLFRFDSLEHSSAGTCGDL